MHQPSRRHGWLFKLFSWPAAAIARVFKPKPDQASNDPKPTTEEAASPVSNRLQLAAAPASMAASARAYRQDGAKHLYALHAKQIYQGRLPPLLYAIGVINVEIDPAGVVTKLDWLRAPRHAPEVVAKIEQAIWQASPFPAPVRLGRVVYTDTWLWHESGQFQLDTLTEGQD